jgi:SAM-dependent methyltransferase
MSELDEIAVINKKHWENTVIKGAGCTIPYLDLDVESYRAYREGKTEILPKPHCDNPVDRVIMKNIQGKNVLCLAAGGGQQSAIYSLLGARVTVFDLAEGQLEGDRKAAEHYGYQVTTIQGDMRDLSRLDRKSFDLVYGTGMAFVPDARQVYGEVIKVLKVGGIYRVDFTNPATEFVEPDSWDGEAYRITLPYDKKIELPKKDGDAIQFRHYMRDIFNGLLELGFSIQQVQDSPLDALAPQPEPGSWWHWLMYVMGIVVVAKKESV